jgi:hypothetical protein
VLPVCFFFAGDGPDASRLTSRAALFPVFLRFVRPGLSSVSCFSCSTIMPFCLVRLAALHAECARLRVPNLFPGAVAVALALAAQVG